MDYTLISILLDKHVLTLCGGFGDMLQFGSLLFLLIEFLNFSLCVLALDIGTDFDRGPPFSIRFIVLRQGCSHLLSDRGHPKRTN